ncbi:DUF262 domain-containing protein [Bradyrhizobium brasilense]|uniref:DUF262 domain-containing protein n=1 Tax=Bradyrhizobium brasilense TaxID=1419277 RepID=UPI0024B24B82|nr:DUF262 domain-containing protein [Bradyrhizobium australafricanum]WFU33162.1 DUF262 domain-containing protein [Bradyrhizobium australafricanum]
MADGTELVDEISGTLKRVSTTALDISFNELLDMAAAEPPELDITPDYQRLFRWSEGQRSRFIESLILEMPVPPIFVIEVEDGRYQLIDGLQRISSYLHFRGQLKAEHLDPPVAKGDFLTLTDCDIVKSLNGKKFSDLPASLQIRLKRAFIRVEVVRKGTDSHFKYHMFKRLNTGGEGLSEQQLRNCAIRMLSSQFPDFIVNMSKVEVFQTCTEALTQARVLSAVDQELVLRFFALKNRRASFKHDVSEFLTEYMEDVADPENDLSFDYVAEEANFRKTFLVLQRTLAEKSFAFRNKAGNDLAAGFSIYHYEAVTMALQAVIEKLDPDNQAQMQTLRDALIAIKLDNTFVQKTTGGGKNSPGLLNERITLVEARLTNAIP